jgi:hypothetical protein
LAALFSGAAYAIDDVDFVCHGKLLDTVRKTETPISGGATMKSDGYLVYVFLDDFKEARIGGTATYVGEDAIHFKPFAWSTLKGANATLIIVYRTKGTISISFGKNGNFVDYMLFLDPCRLDIKKRKF